MNSNTALLLIDIQNGIFQLPVPLHEKQRFITNAKSLLAHARKNRWKVVFAQHAGAKGHPLEKGTEGWGLHPAFSPQDGEPVIEKSNPDSFQQSDLEDILKKGQVQRIVVCGFATQSCVDTAVRVGAAKGFTITLAADAHTTTQNPTLEAHQIVAHHNFILQSFADIRSTAEICI